METAAEAVSLNRELTATEIKIAIAQIEDRFSRLAKAQKKLSDAERKCEEIESKSEEEIEALEDAYASTKESVRLKYEIPEGVHIFDESEVECFKPSSMTCLFKQYVADFVRGRMSEESFSHLYWYFEEIEEIDWGWALIERPFYYFQADSEKPEGERDVNYVTNLVAEMKRIATRSGKPGITREPLWYYKNFPGSLPEKSTS